MNSQIKDIIRKSIIRFHKDRGTYALFKKRCPNLESEISMASTETFVKCVYNVFLCLVGKNICKRILASVSTLEIIDILYGKGLTDLDALCSNIARSEFMFIKDCVTVFGTFDTLPNEVKEKINNTWKKYSYLLSKTDYTYLQKRYVRIL